MPRKRESIDDKINKQKAVVLELKDKYDSALNELNLLMKKKHDTEGMELLKAIKESGKSLSEILASIREEADDKGSNTL